MQMSGTRKAVVHGQPNQGWKDPLSLDCEMFEQWGKQSPEQFIPKPNSLIK